MFKVVFPIQHNLIDYAPGAREVIMFSDDGAAARDELLALGVIRAFEDVPADVDGDLSRLSAKALVAIAAAEKVNVGEKPTKASLIAAIEDARMAAALANHSGFADLSAPADMAPASNTGT